MCVGERETDRERENVCVCERERVDCILFDVARGWAESAAGQFIATSRLKRVQTSRLKCIETCHLGVHGGKLRMAPGFPDLIKWTPHFV